MTGSDEVEALLRDLDSAKSEFAWEKFVEDYGPVLLQVVHLFESDSESVHDCFMFICEKLVANRFHRLRKYSAREGARFTTWLHSVARNLCIDWQRSQSGRRRTFSSVKRLSTVEQRIFRLHFIGGHPSDQVWKMLGCEASQVSEAEVPVIIERIGSSLTARQRWLLSCQASRTSRLPGFDPEYGLLGSEPSPEEQLLRSEELGRLNRSLAKLSPLERLLLKLRFEEGLSLQACAESLGMENTQKVHRTLTSVLSRLRAMMST